MVRPQIANRQIEKALRKDPGMLIQVKEISVPVSIMHMQGTPGDMQVKPQYENVVAQLWHYPPLV